MRWDITGTDIESNLMQLLAEAPATRCGACDAPMDAKEVDVTISTDFDWHMDFEPTSDLKAFDMPVWRYTGSVTYTCPQCGVTLLHRQQVTHEADGFHFQPPNEG